jgi:polyphosphate kinase 2 (PPK2 family)
MGFCSDEEYEDFLRTCPEFERMLVRSGITLLKYWFSVSDEEQERRFKERAGNPARRWKLSPMDLQSMDKWEEYSRAKDVMFKHTDTKKARWWTVEADNKRRARLNCIAHILSSVPYKDAVPPPLALPKRHRRKSTYKRPPKSDQHFVPELKP